MKLKSFIALVLMMVLTLCVIGCNEFEKEFANISKDLIDQNVIERDNQNNENYFDYNISEGYYDYVYDSSYLSQGLIVLNNSYDYLGFYSLYFDKLIVKNQFYKHWVDYKVYRNSEVGFVLKIDYENKTYIYDSLGNELYNGDIINNLYVNSYIINNKVYLELTDYNAIYYYEYNDGQATPIYYLPEDNNYYEDNKDDNDEPSQVGNIFRDSEKLDLSEYGNDSYYTTYNENNYTVYFFNKHDECISKFTLDDNYDVIIVGDYLYIQESIALGSDAESYDYYDAYRDQKYMLKNKKFNYITNKIEEFDFKYVITDFEVIKNEKGVKNYAIVSLMKINEYKTLNPSRVYLADDAFSQIQYVGDMDLTNFIKAGDSYLDCTTKILYDNNLNFITDLSSFSKVTPVDNLNMFVVEKNGRQGLISYDGIVRLECKYFIKYSNKPNYKDIIVYENNNIELYSVENNKLYRNEEYEGNLITYDTDLYGVYSSDTNELKLISLKGTTFGTFTLPYGLIDYVKINETSLFNGDCKRKVITIMEEYQYINLLLIYDDNTYIAKENGNENYNVCLDNSQIDYASYLNLGENYKHLSWKDNSSTYFKFTVSQRGFYTFDGLTSLSVLEEYHDNSDFVTISSRGNSSDYDGMMFTVLLNDNQTYVLKTNNYNYSDCFTFNIYMEDGSNSQYPIFITSESKTFDFSVSSKYTFVYIFPLTGSYTFLHDSSCELYDSSGSFVSLNEYKEYKGNNEYMFTIRYDSLYQYNQTIEIKFDTTGYESSTPKVINELQGELCVNNNYKSAYFKYIPNVSSIKDVKFYGTAPFRVMAKDNGTAIIVSGSAYFESSYDYELGMYYVSIYHELVSGHEYLYDLRLTENVYEEQVLAIGTIGSGYKIYNNCSYPFSVSTHTGTNTDMYTSTNKSNSSSSYFIISAEKTGVLSFNYNVSTESGYDIMYVTKNGINLYSFSGNRQNSVSINVTKGDVIEITYTKDYSGYDGSDQIQIYNINLTY